MIIRGIQVLLASTLLVCGVAQAEMGYTYAEAGFGSTELDLGGGTEVDGDGFLLGGSIAVTGKAHVFADFSTADMDFDVDLTRYKVGFGLNHGLSDRVDLVGRVAWVKFDVETPIGDADEDGYGIDLGLRGQVSDTFELEGGIEYIDLGSSGGDDTSFVAQGRYSFTEQFSLGGQVEVGDDFTVYGILARLNF